MIRVSVLYPNNETAKFDMDYYCKSHMPMVQRLLGPALKGMTVDHGLSGAVPGSRPPFAGGAHLLFESVSAFQSAFTPHMQTIMGDIPNYTNIQPVVQISEVKL